MKTLFFSLILFAGGTTLNAAEPKTLSIAVIQEWTQFNPVTIQVASTSALINFVVRGMVERDSSGSLIPDVAVSIPSLKNKKAKLVTRKGKKQLQVEWEIRSEAKWGDGKQITCADWWQGWQVGLNPNVSVSGRQPFSKIANIEWSEKTPHKCLVTYTGEDWAFDRDLPPLLPKHIEESVFEKFKSQSEAYDQNSIYVKDPTQAGLYNGPYVITEFKLGSHFVLKPNPHFYGTKPQIENVVFKHIPNTGTLKSHLLTGEINMISANGFPGDLALQLDQESKISSTNFRVHFVPSPIYQGLFLNLENETLKDLKVRQALSHAIDKVQLSEAFFQGRLEAAESIFPKLSLAAQPEKPKYNPNETKRLLESAGWKLNAKKVFEKNGKPLILEFTTSAGIKVLETIQGYICDQFLKSGIQCIVKNSPPRIFLGQSVPHGEYTMGMFGSPILPDSSMTSLFSSAEIPTEKNGWAGGNSSRLNSKKADELVLKLDGEWDTKKRIQLMRAIEKEVLDQVSVIPLYHRKEAFIVPKSLSGFTDDVSGVNFLFPERWRL